MSDVLAVLPQYLYPKKALTAFGAFVAGSRGGWITTRIIRWFVKRYHVNMEEAANPDVTTYPTFNEFFTRALKDGARPLAHADFICPVDGTISQCGPIVADQIFQAKGHHYSTTALLGGDAELAKAFDNGSFVNLYLSPRDYHRIHMPCDGTLRQMIYVPGDLFSVNPTTARGVPGLFARNERVVCVFDGAQGPFVMVLVGAMVVGSMATVWHGVVNPPRGGPVRRWSYPAAGGGGAVHLRKGQEMGRFLLGSTIVALFPQGNIQINPQWATEKSIRLGETMGARPTP